MRTSTTPAAHLCLVGNLPSWAKRFWWKGQMRRLIKSTLPEQEASSPRRSVLYDSARGKGRADCNPPAYPARSESFWAIGSQNAAAAAAAAALQNLPSHLCPPVSERSDWLSPTSCFLHWPDCWPFWPWADKLRHLGSTFPTLNSKRKLLSSWFFAPAINWRKRLKALRQT